MPDREPPIAPKIRCRVDPRDVPPEKAARRLGLTLAKFEERLPGLLDRGFPLADVTTGNYDLDEIDRWRARRHGSVAQLVEQPKLSMGDKFREAQNRKRNGTAA